MNHCGGMLSLKVYTTIWRFSLASCTRMAWHPQQGFGYCLVLPFERRCNKVKYSCLSSTSKQNLTNAAYITTYSLCLSVGICISKLSWWQKHDFRFHHQNETKTKITQISAFFSCFCVFIMIYSSTRREYFFCQQFSSLVPEECEHKLFVLLHKIFYHAMWVLFF